MTDPTPAALDAFIERWEKAQAAELANAQTFYIELCDLLGVARPEPATKDPAQDAYVFERPVEFQDAAGGGTGRIDVYRRAAFVLETKQGVDAELAAQKKGKKAAKRPAGHGKRGTPAWDRTMAAAKRQAERYARNLDRTGVAPEPVPPLVIACDVGHSFDLFANFGHPQRYVPFPDQKGYRILLADLRKAEPRERLRLALSDPDALDPARRQAKVTRELAATLARLAASLERSGHAGDAVFGFLSRCLFTMFAEDAGLVPARSFTGLLEEYRAHLDVLPAALEDLWATMDAGGFSAALKAHLRRFNGSLFKDRSALRLTEDELGLLLDAAGADWLDVEPAIFGTLLERALDPRERHKLGAHYTPRAYVERLVVPAVVDPLRERWEATQAAVALVEAEAEEKTPQGEQAVTKHQRATRRAVLAEYKRFFDRLTSVRVLDPACGSGNFLYVVLEHLKRIEAEVLEAMGRYGGAGALELAGAAVTPAQLLGIELNPRAAALADLVLWIGHLQWHLRTYGGPQGLADPVLQAYGNVECRDAVLAYTAKTPRLDEHGEAVTIWDGRTTKPNPTTGREVPDTTARRALFDYENPQPAPWPEADFIVGNPPFTGGWKLRDEHGDGYVEALWSAYPHVPRKADLVMYWWDRAAAAVRSGETDRFGLITTNSAGQVFQERVIRSHVAAKEHPLRLTFAVADHPWVDEVYGAAVRVAMTVGERAADSSGPVEYGRVVPESQIWVSVRGSASTIQLRDRLSPEEKGRMEGRSSIEEGREELVVEPVDSINSDLSVGADLTQAKKLKANKGLSSPGVQLYGDGFIMSAEEAEAMNAAISADVAAEVVRPYLNGRDVMGSSRGAFVIDFFGRSADEAAEDAPAAYQRVLDLVKPSRDQNSRKAIRETWWRFGWERPRWREMSAGLSRFIATPETAKHRVFVFLPAEVLPDNMVTCIASDDAYHLGVLSSRPHVVWALGAGGTLEDRPRYTKTKTLEPFPFPAATAEQAEAVRKAAQALDAHRKRVQADHPELTLTALYNVLEADRAGSGLDNDLRDVYDRGLVGRLRELHQRLDLAVAAAYGWPAGLSDQQILTRLVTLNAERQAEEAAGHVRYLRPDFQAPGETTQATLAVGAAPVATAAAEPEPWPASSADRVLALLRILRAADGPLTVEVAAQRFKRAPRAAVADLLAMLVQLGQARAVNDAFAT